MPAPDRTAAQRLFADSPAAPPPPVFQPDSRPLPSGTHSNPARPWQTLSAATAARNPSPLFGSPETPPPAPQSHRYAPPSFPRLRGSSQARQKQDRNRPSVQHPSAPALGGSDSVATSHSRPESAAGPATRQ